MTPSLFSRLLAVARSIPALLGASKAQQPIRTASEFPRSKLRVPAFPPPIPTAAFGWPLEAIRDARAEQIAGRFKRPVQLAVAMRTHGDLYSAWRVRTAPLSALGVKIVPAKKARGKSVAREAEVPFGEPGPNRGVGCSQATVKTIISDLANHAVAIGYNTWTAREDGGRHDVVHRPWPLEFVWYSDYDDQLYTEIDVSMTLEERKALSGELSERAQRRGRVPDMFRVPITHGDGRWTVYKLSDVLPWRQDAAILPGSITWASAAYADRDWNRGSTSHGNAKIVGKLPEGQSLQQAVLDENDKPTGEYDLTDEADAMMALLSDLAKLESPYGLAQFGSEIEVLANPSNMWQVWRELGLRAQKLAYLIYTGSTAGLGSQGDAPGVNIEQLLDINMQIVAGDKAAFELGFHEGVMVPWTARNFGDSSLAPQRLYQLPDVDAQRNREDATKNEDAFARAYNVRKEAGILTQDWADEYADRLGVPRVQVPPEHLEPAPAGGEEQPPASGVRAAA
jgi:hypothetical protein